MTDPARADVLMRVRSAGAASHLTAVAHPGSYVVPAEAHAAASRADRFVAQLLASGAQVERVQSVPPPDAHTEYLTGALGVAESGAVWVAPRTVRERQQLFLAEHVTLVVPIEAIVETLHDAYALLDVRAVPFGCFVCGPSKTADIEQTLVIGAHGPLGLTVLLLG